MATSTLSTRNIPLDQIEDSPYQPRGAQDDELRELADSIKAFGVLEPVLVRSVDSHFELIAGHRRKRAAALAGLSELPSIIHEVAARQAAEMTLEENIKRKDLNPIERARFLKRYIEEFSVVQAEAAARFNMAQESVSNYLRLLEAPPAVTARVEDGRLLFSHARELLRLSEHPEQMIELATDATNEDGINNWDGMPTVRQLSEAVDDELANIERLMAEPPTAGSKEPKTLDKAALKERLIEGLVKTGDRQLPYVDEEGRIVYFQSVRFGGELYSIVSPALPRDGFNPRKDKTLMATLASLGVELDWRIAVNGDKPTIGMGDPGWLKFTRDPGWLKFTRTAELRRLTQVPAGARCPCSGEHVIARGWGADNGYRETATAGKVQSEPYCTEPHKVVLALAHYALAARDELRAKQEAEQAMIAKFLDPAGSTDDRQIALFLLAALFTPELTVVDNGDGSVTSSDSMDDATFAGVAQLPTAALYHKLCELAVEFVRENGSIGDVLAIIQQVTGAAAGAGTPATD